MTLVTYLVARSKLASDSNYLEFGGKGYGIFNRRQGKLSIDRSLLRRSRFGGAVVLIHGYPLSGRSWEKQVAALLGVGHRVITYDRRGFGESSQPTTGYDYDTFASDLDKLMKHLNLRDTTIVGFSMGPGGRPLSGTYGLDRIGKVAICRNNAVLLKSADHPEGDSTRPGIRNPGRDKKGSVRFLTGFYKDFYNLDSFLGNRISEEAVRDSWNVGAGASPEGTYQCPPRWLTDFRRTWPRSVCPRWSCTALQTGSCRSLRRACSRTS